jgi:hypothetical protein
MATLDEHGREVLDQTPVSVPFKFERPEPIHLRLRRQIIDAMVAAERDGEYEVTVSPPCARIVIGGFLKSMDLS